MQMTDRQRPRYHGLTVQPRQAALSWCGLLLISVALCYGQLWNAQFVKWDDLGYLVKNAQVHAGLTLSTVRWAFTTLSQYNYHPLTWLSHALDWQLFGAWAGGHHLVSVALHASNSVLLFLALFRMTGSVHRSGLCAALFALHPLHVESVAWVAERKDLLSTLFALLALLAYVGYVRHPAKGRYLLMVGLFAAGLLCKPMLVSFPALLLLLDVWPLGRLDGVGSRPPPWSLLREKLPLFALSAASGAITIYAQRRGGATAALHHPPGLTARLGNAVVAYAFYLEKTVWPTDLAYLYPHPGSWPAGRVALSLALCAGIGILVAWHGRARPHLWVGWLWFLGMLVPVIGLMQVGMQAYADRYTYLPLCGLFVMGVWSVPAAWARRHPLPCVGVALALLLALALCTARQAATWRNSRALFTRGIAVVPDNPVAYNWLGVDAAEHGDLKEAESDYRRALALDEQSPWPHINLAGLLIKKGRDEEAIQHLTRAAQLSDLGKADPSLREALRKRTPEERADFYQALAASLKAQGSLAEANRYQRLAGAR